MSIETKHRRSGLTLIELLVTAVAAVVVVLGIVSMIAYSHQGYNRLFRRMTRGVVPQAYEARLIFDRIVRKSVGQPDGPTGRGPELLSPRNGGYDALRVYYYSDAQNLPIGVPPDRYAWFYLSGTQLLLEQGGVGGWNGRVPTDLSPTSRAVLADNVSADAGDPGIFSAQGLSVRMALMLDSETDAQAGVSKIETLKMTVTPTAIPHNR
jgi:hypothetical protein